MVSDIALRRVERSVDKVSVGRKRIQEVREGFKGGEMRKIRLSEITSEDQGRVRVRRGWNGRK